MLKKYLSMFLVSVLTLSMAACGGKSSQTNAPSASPSAAQTSAAPAKKVKLSIATSLYVEAPHKKALDNLIKAYNSKNPNIEITVYGSNYDNYWDNLTVEIMSDNQGDIIQMYPENIGRYHALKPNGTFIDLAQYMKKTNLKDKLAGQELCDYEGKTLAVSSYATSVTGIFYRKALFKNAGVDPNSIKTIEDMRSAAKKLTKDGVYGLSFVIAAHPFAVSEWSRLIARPISNGIYFKNGEAAPYTADNININSPENIWAAQWWSDVYNIDKTAKAVNNKKETRELFWNNKVAMSMDGSWFIGMTQERDASLMDDIGLIPSPMVEYSGKTYKANPTMYAVTSLISNKCANKDEAWKFLEWMTTDEAQQLIEVSGMIPSNRDYVAKTNFKSRSPLAYQLYEFGENLYADKLIADPAIPQQGELQQVMIDAVQQVFAAKKDPKAIFDDAAKQMKTVMSKK